MILVLRLFLHLYTSGCIVSQCRLFVNRNGAVLSIAKGSCDRLSRRQFGASTHVSVTTRVRTCQEPTTVASTVSPLFHIKRLLTVMR